MLGKSRSDLLVMAPGNDPFSIGTQAHIAAAEWFAALCERHPALVTHIRRCHYRAIDDPTPKPDGERYSNTFRDWCWLCNAAKWARILGYLPAESIIDRRSSPWKWAGIDDPYAYAAGYGGAVVHGATWRQPVDLLDERPDFTDDAAPYLAMPYVADSSYRYSYDDDVRIGVVIEKSTSDDVLDPLAERLHVDLLSATGYASITRAREWLTRDTERPARLLYLSDFDPAGASMPQCFARQVEGFIDREDLKADVAINPLALTLDQVHEYELPPQPLETGSKVTKAVATKRQRFMDTYGVAGAVEIDALVARHPGALERIITDQVRALRDTSLPDRMREAKSEASRQVIEVWNTHQPVLQPHIDQAKADQQAALDKLAAAYEAFEAETESIEGRVTDAAADLEQDLDQLDLPDRPTPERDDQEHDWMYRSDRSYLEQLRWYPKLDGAA